MGNETESIYVRNIETVELRRDNFDVDCPHFKICTVHDTTNIDTKERKGWTCIEKPPRKFQPLVINARPQTVW